MIELSQYEQDAYTAGAYTVHTRVYIANWDGSLVELTNLAGRDWVRSVVVRADINSPVSTCDITLTRKFQKHNLSPFYLNSPEPTSRLIDLYREVLVQVAITTPSADPDADPAARWIDLFRGSVYELNVADSPITIRAHDYVQRLVDAYIETATTYGGDQAEESIARIIADWVTDFPIVFRAIKPTNWPLTTYTQNPDSVWNAVQHIVAQFGWDIRQMTVGPNVHELILYEPGRDLLDVLYDVPPSLVRERRRVDMSLSTVRNRVRVSYGSGTPRPSVVEEDSNSIARYGLRYMEFVEAATSGVDTLEEAQALARAALADLAYPLVGWDVVLPAFPFVQINDYIRFQADGRFSDQDLKAAVKSYEHRLTKNRHETTIRLDGKPSAGYVQWLERESRSAVPTKPPTS